MLIVCILPQKHLGRSGGHRAVELLVKGMGEGIGPLCNSIC